MTVCRINPIRLITACLLGSRRVEDNEHLPKMGKTLDLSGFKQEFRRLNLRKALIYKGFYQEDLVMPGSSPLCAMLRKRTRETPNLVKTPRGRPSIASRLRTRVGLAFLGSFCRPRRASSLCSSVELGSTKAFFKAARFSA